ncbi:PAC2 family protein [Candidatus Micrarchaeota archaeon]|nr:PAC2 family protein [Candidatus Micrarchaeota archaeon]
MTDFRNSFIIEKKRPKLKDPLLIVGLPGIGLVSKLAVDHLAKSLGAEHFATLYSPHFPNQVLALKSGKLRTFSMKLYYKKLKNHDIVLLRGDLQPLTVEGQYEVSSEILSYYAKIGGKNVVAMAGYAINRATEKPQVYAFATNKGYFGSWIKAGAVKNEIVVPIVGMAGLLPALSKLYGLRGAALLAETPGNIIDANGAKALAQLLFKWMGEKLDVKALDAKAKKAQMMFQQIEQQARNEEAAAINRAGLADKPDVHPHLR